MSPLEDSGLHEGSPAVAAAAAVELDDTTTTLESPRSTISAESLEAIQQQLSNNNLKSNNQNKSSPSESLKDSMVRVEDGVKSYGRNLILNHLNMNVQKGTIYSLLGASGCGKTTLLSCIVGTKLLNDGGIYFCGESMESIKYQGGLRSRVGYMPQELALYKEFTIQEILQYFGRIYGMSSEFISLQADFLVDFLKLPPKTSEIRQLSGGQQRRASFAVALLHAPELLILDEPTVGVDPILRKSIWEHLKKLVEAGNTTVIITTHYIEEAKDADVVGMMRNGRILAEGQPAQLMKAHACANLEDLFLALSITDEHSKDASKQEVLEKSADNSKVYSKPVNIMKNMEMLREVMCLPSCSSVGGGEKAGGGRQAYFHRLHALTMKNVIYIWRQLAYIFILLFLPAIELLLSCLAVGGEPWGIGFGIVNRELQFSNYTNCSSYFEVKSCETLLLSCDFVEALDSQDTLKLLHYESEEQAAAAVSNGDSWGYLSIPPNFTRLSLEKSLAGFYADNHTVLNSRVHIRLDMSSVWNSGTIQTALFETFQDTMKSMVADCEPSYILEIVDGPLWFDDPIYGERKPTLVQYISPGVLLLVMFFAAISVTGMSYVVEKKQGMLERTIVAGVSTTEIITAQLLIQLIIIVIQTVFCLIVIFGFFEVHVKGNLAYIVVLILLQGGLGMLLGFVLSSVCDDEGIVMQLSIALTIPCTVLGGVFWPLSSMPTILRYFSLIFIPQTIPLESIRSIMHRGWDISHPNVWPGFVVTITWLLVLWTIASVFAKRSVSPKK